MESQAGRTMLGEWMNMAFVGMALAGLILALGIVVWPDVSCQNFLADFITDHLGNANYVFRLYVNNVVPGTGTLLANLTQATFAGYAAIAGNTITWPAPSLAGHVAQTTGSNLTWTNTSGFPQQVYGVYVTNVANTRLYYVERDPFAPVTIPNGGTYVYTPNQQYRSIN